nr:formin-like protein 18 [Equus caballus]
MLGLRGAAAASRRCGGKERGRAALSLRQQRPEPPHRPLPPVAGAFPFISSPPPRARASFRREPAVPGRFAARRPRQAAGLMVRRWGGGGGPRVPFPGRPEPQRNRAFLLGFVTPRAPAASLPARPQRRGQRRGPATAVGRGAHARGPDPPCGCEVCASARRRCCRAGSASTKARLHLSIVRKQSLNALEEC